ncbi:thiol methyltransferase [Xylariales sp. PMI_506]|nr:thiol methyltransferase [Xylariales sp. PMI_506]
MAAQGGTAAELPARFENQPFSEHGSRWNSLWQEEFTPWDRGGPSLALLDLLEERPELFSFSSGGGGGGGGASRRTALVPGCGKGHDALLLASFGFDVCGLDVSDVALAEARKNADAVRDDPVYQPRKGIAGTNQWVAGDFFKDDWLEEAGVKTGKFDLVFDYTFLSALPPAVRPAWAKRMADLLLPGGRLVCLEFPSINQPSAPGPPWALPPQVYLAYLSRPGEEVAVDKYGGVLVDDIQDPKAGGLKRLLHVHPKRTHPAGVRDGNVVDWISVWSHYED